MKPFSKKVILLTFWAILTGDDQVINSKNDYFFFEEGFFLSTGFGLNETNRILSPKRNFKAAAVTPEIL